MTPETQARVFEPFFTTKDSGHGTGLGLATVHGLVAQHRGAIHIDSTVGRGTRMKVYLPVATAVKHDTVLSQLPAVSGGTETVLVAEDEPLVLELTRSSLLAAGYKVFAAANGVEALEVVESRAQQLDLAVLDVVMPQLGGEAVLRRLRELRPGIPVVFASGYGSRIPANQPQLAGIAFLQKPYGREELLRRIREMLDGPR
jgi:CheY-like chemotaxis protein